jgi:hypothetical protein
MSVAEPNEQLLNSAWLSVEDVQRISIVLVADVPKLQLLKVLPVPVEKNTALVRQALIVQLLNVLLELEYIPNAYPDGFAEPFAPYE